MIRLWFISLLLILGLQASEIEQKIENLIGAKEYRLHKNLIALMLTNESNFFLPNGQLSYPVLLKELKQNGILNLQFSSPQDIEVEFQTNTDPIKSLKILNDTLKALGYYYYFTKSTQYTADGLLIWTIKLKTEFAIDPLIFINEISKNDCKVIEIKKTENNKWIYKIDTNFANISESIFIESNELTKLQKPLRPYFLRINQGRVLKVDSNVADRWYPHVVFYDEHLNILSIIKNDQFSKQISYDIPMNTKYIKITDFYALDNIKRGLNVIIKE